MARPAKKGLEYFSHDTNASTSREIEYLESRFGLVGYAIYLKILERVYGHEGYYLPWTEIDRAIFAKHCGIEIAELDEIVEVCFVVDVFSRWIYDANQVLTSAGVQKRFLMASQRKARTEINPKFNLLTGVIAAETPAQPELLQQKPPQSDDDPELLPTETPQKKRKEKKRKETKTLCASVAARRKDFERFWTAFDLKKGKQPAWDKSWLKITHYTPELVEQIIAAAKEEAARRPALIADGNSPKWAQGWITDRRWEDEPAVQQQLAPKHKSKMDVVEDRLNQWAGGSDVKGVGKENDSGDDNGPGTIELEKLATGQFGR
jgi:hypothetical protein